MPPKTSLRARGTSSPPSSPRTRVTRSRSVDISNNRANRRAAKGTNGNAAASAGRAPSQELGAVNEDTEYDLPENDIPAVDDLRDPSPTGSQGGSSQNDSPSQETNTFYPEVELDLANDPVARQLYKEAMNRANEEAAAQAAHATRLSVQQNQQVQDEPPFDFDTPLDDVLSTWARSRQEKNKENRRPRLIDPHPAATKDTWDSQTYIEQSSAAPPPGNPSNKRPYQSFAEDAEEDQSQDGFQADTRPIDHSRRMQAPPRQPQAKRTRQEEPLPSSARHADIVDNLTVEQMVQTQAKVITQQVGLKTRKVQVRRPWSRNDEELLVRYIGEHGCCWSVLAKLGGWEIMRDNMQVDLKDKARNLKVAFLKAGVDLPINFHGVRLGQKEIAAVHKVRPEYDQEAELLEAEM